MHKLYLRLKNTKAIQLQSFMLSLYAVRCTLSVYTIRCNAQYIYVDIHVYFNRRNPTPCESHNNFSYASEKQ